MVVIVLGLALGFVVGRWTALITGVIFAIWVGIAAEADELKPWREIVVKYAVVAAAAVAAGVLGRRQLFRQ